MPDMHGSLQRMRPANLQQQNVHSPRVVTSVATRAAWLGAMQRSVMDMRGSLTGGMQCCAASAPFPFSTSTEPGREAGEGGNQVKPFRGLLQ